MSSLKLLINIEPVAEPQGSHIRIVSPTNSKNDSHKLLDVQIIAELQEDAD